jgi:hypothetical protein
MKILYSTCALCLLTAFMWFPCSTQGNAQGLTKEELDDQIQKNLNTPIACGCSVYDYDDLDNRIKLASMIRSEFAAAKKQYAGKKQTLTPEIRNTVQNPIRGKINSTKNPKANDAGAVTYDFGCFTIIDSNATPCLRGALDDHEAVHRKVCDAHPNSDFRYNQLVEDWLQEEMDAYDQELKRLTEERNKMLPFCKLDPSVKKALVDMANEREREQEAQQIADWFLGLFN